MTTTPPSATPETDAACKEAAKLGDIAAMYGFLQGTCESPETRLRAAEAMVISIDEENGSLKAKLIDTIATITQQLEEAQREISVLRQFGNKDCTAMADAALRGDNNA